MCRIMFVKGKAIDREALKRGTSTYLVDRAVHMLPPLLSENLCSLKAGEDRPRGKRADRSIGYGRAAAVPLFPRSRAGGAAPDLSAGRGIPRRRSGAGRRSSFPGEILGQMDRLQCNCGRGVCSVGSSTSISLSRSLFLTTRGRFSAWSAASWGVRNL